MESLALSEVEWGPAVLFEEHRIPMKLLVLTFVIPSAAEGSAVPRTSYWKCFLTE